MRLSPVTFTIDTTDISYNTDLPICIDNISYSYGCVGLTLPQSFYFCGNAEIFEVDVSSCNCTILEDIGFDTLKLDSLICTPVNSTFILRENFNIFYDVQCVLPLEHPPIQNPLSFQASLYSYIEVNTNISTTIKKPLALKSANVTVSKLKVFLFDIVCHFYTLMYYINTFIFPCLVYLTN